MPPLSQPPSLGGDWRGPRPRKRTRELGEDREVGVKPYGCDNLMSRRALLVRGVGLGVGAFAGSKLFLGEASAAGQVKCGEYTLDDGSNLYLVTVWCDAETGEQVGETWEWIGSHC